MMRHAPTDLELEMHARGPLRISDSEELRFVERLWRAAWRVRYWAFAAALLGGIAAYLYSLTLEERFTTGARVMLNTSARPEQTLGPVTSTLPISATTLESEMQVMSSLDLIDAVARERNLYSDSEFAEEEDAGSVAKALADMEAWFRQVLASLADGLLGAEEIASSEEQEDLGESGRQQRILESLADRVSVLQLGDLSAVYVIQFTSEDAQKAADIANALAEKYIEAQTLEVLATSERAREWLVARTEEAEVELDRLNAELEEQVVSATSAGDQTESLQQQRSLAAERLEEIKAEIAALERALSMDGSSDLGALLEAARGIPEPSRQLQLAIESAASGGAVDALRAEYSREREILEARLQQSRSLAELVQQDLAEQERRLSEQVKYVADLRRLESRISVAESVYEGFAELLGRQSNQERFVEPNARIISYARPPLDPSEPRRKRLSVLSGFLAGLAIVGFATLKEAFTRRLRTVRDYEDTTSLPVLGMVPRMSRLGPGLKSILTRHKRLDPVAERNMRRLRVQIASEAEALGRSEPRVIIGASSVSGEGKSLSMTLLAITYAAMGERVLLIDADFWRSAYWGVLPRRTVNYSELAWNPDTIESMVHSLPDIGLDILVAPEDLAGSAEFLTSLPLEDFVNSMRDRYNRVLIDAPPVLALADVLPLYRVADATLLFVRWNVTARSVVRSTLKALASVRVEPLGCVATRIDLRRVHSYSDDEFTHLATAYRSGY